MIKGKTRITYILQSVSIFPLLSLGAIILMLGTWLFRDAMYQSVETDMRSVCLNLATTFDALYPGDYKYEASGEDGGRLYKGGHDLTCDYTLIDSIKQNTNLDITLFYQDVRILTTVVNTEGNRIVGSTASQPIVKEVLKSGQGKFFSDALVYNTTYFAYYAPLINSDGTLAGMLFVGRPTADVDASIWASILPLVVTDVFFMLIVSLVIFLYTRSFTSALMQIHSFLKEVSAGNLESELPAGLLKRNDELSEIARAVLNMQHSLRSLVEQDSLTLLANRRFGDKQLRQLMKNAAADGTDFCIAIGDIDDFKQVNDTYGHDCGDFVLKNVADVLRRRMLGNGFAARWGGEEFLLVFENKDVRQAQTLLQDILEEIRSMEYRYDDVSVNVTMTFGLAPGNTDSVTELLRAADENLYRGKNSGKNQVV